MALIAVVHIEDITPTTDSTVQFGGHIDLINTATSPPTITRKTGQFTVAFGSLPAVNDTAAARALAKSAVIATMGQTPDTTYLIGWPL